MAQHFHPLIVSKVQRETPDAVCVEFALSGAQQELFAWQAGQHLTLRHTINGEEVRRNYSICTAPAEQRMQIGIKAVPGGVFSNWANTQMKAGDILDVMPPTGGFTLHRDAEDANSFVFIAAGSGITPILSLLTHLLHTRPGSNCTLVYANRTRSSIMFRERLEALKNRFLQRFQLIHILSREATDSPLHHGRIDAAKCSALFGRLVPLDGQTRYYCCGPAPLIETVKTFLANQAVPPDHIHHELFLAAGPAGLPAKAPETADDDTEVSQAALQYELDGVKATLRMPKKGTNILDAIRMAGADAPYACKGGVCCTCKAKLLQGDVSMDVVYGLEPEEIAAGYILTCQAHPTTDAVSISYDG